MKRLSLCVFVVCAACLLLTPVALASTKARHFAPERVRHASSLPRSYGRLAADPTYAISGHVYDFSGAPVQGAEVDWGYWATATSYQYEGYFNTDAGGAFSFPAVTGGHQILGGVPADDLHVWYNPDQNTGKFVDGLIELGDYSLDFSTTSDFALQPAQVNVTVANAPFSPIYVAAGNANIGLGRTEMTLDDNGNGVANVLPMASFDDVTAYYYTWLSNGYSAVRSAVEWLGTTPVAVTGGTTATDPVNLDWSAAEQAKLAGPSCRHSGKPGTKVLMVLSGWPAGETASLLGYPGGVAKGSVTSTGPDQMYPVQVTIPATAPVGVYEIDTYRSDTTDSLVQMWDLFQVCTFKPSTSSILHGHAVRLSGRVPGTGNVTVYATTHKVSAAPGTLAATGWHRVGSYKTSSGRFTTSLLHPTHTTYYVVKYNGFAFPAFTPVTRVGVR